MSKTKRKRKKLRVNTNKRTIDELVSIVKKLQEREESLLIRIDDLEFYIETLELELFDEGDSESQILTNQPPIEQEVIQLHTIDEVLKELGEEQKKKKNGKNKKKRRK